MAVSLAQFRSKFKEFALSDTDVVSRELATAHRMLSEDIFGAQYDDAVGYQAAILLHNSIFGIPAAKKESSIASGYRLSLDTIRMGLGNTRFAVLGGCP